MHRSRRPAAVLAALAALVLPACGDDDPEPAPATEPSDDDMTDDSMVDDDMTDDSMVDDG